VFYARKCVHLLGGKLQSVTVMPVDACICWEECVGPAISGGKAPVVACSAVEVNTIMQFGAYKCDLIPCTFADG